jgi:hypothetical protein
MEYSDIPKLLFQRKENEHQQNKKMNVSDTLLDKKTSHFSLKFSFFTAIHSTSKTANGYFTRMLCSFTE